MCVHWCQNVVICFFLQVKFCVDIVTVKVDDNSFQVTAFDNKWLCKGMHPPTSELSLLKYESPLLVMSMVAVICDPHSPSLVFCSHC